MPDARVTRFGFEVLAAAPERAGVTRQGIQVAVERPGANSAATADVTRFGFEVLAQTPDIAKVTRQGLQVAVERPGANSAANARVTRIGHEVLAQATPRAKVTRQGIQVAIERPASLAGGTARVTRFGYEVLGRRFVQMTQFAVPANFELFFHNWALRSALESSYSTDVAASSDELAEERVGLIERPYRSYQVQWAAGGTNEEANRFLVEMRRLVDETSVVPLYCDSVKPTSDVASSANEIPGDFSRGRFFQNGPVVVVQRQPTVVAGKPLVQFEIANVSKASSASLTLKAGLSNSYLAANTQVMPLLQTHEQTEVTIESLTNRLMQASITFDEIYGPSAIPPVASNLPGGFDSYADFPILSTAPQWLNGLTSRIVRQGSQDALGRGRVVYQRGSRGRRASGLDFLNYREIAWNLIRFFDSRRGRLLPFWVIDYDNLFTVSNINASFVSVSPVGDLADFQAETDYVGVVFSDGKAAVREATTVQQVGGSWRVTLDSSLPSGYTASDIVNFGRARLCRMESDSLQERWWTNAVCEMSIPVIELLAEQEVSIG